MADTPVSTSVKPPVEASRYGRRMSVGRREALAGYLFIAPAVIGFFAFSAGPILVSLYFSFTDYDILNWPPNWIGLDNYHTALNDPLFWQAVQVTGKFAA